MKKLIFLLVSGIILSSGVYGQNIYDPKKDKQFKVEAGYVLLYNDKDDYLTNTYYLQNDYDPLKGIHLKFTLPTSYDFIDIVFGAIIAKVNMYEFAPKSYVLNGGGVYAGISPKAKGKRFGLTSDFGIGIFPFKEYYYADEIETRIFRGSTFGAMASVGFYVNFGERCGINPTYNMLVAGGGNGSFLFTGFIIPLTYKF